MMKQSSWQSLAFLVLIGLNLSLIGFLVFRGNDAGPPQGGPPNGGRGPGMGPPQMIEKFLKQELGWDEEQMAEFEIAKKAHLSESSGFKENMRRLRGELHALDQSEADAAREILHQIGQQQAELERSIWEHFQILRAICNPEQQVRFDRLKGDLLRRSGPPERRRPRP
ncbi:MAG: periplasmic heavy metal sensor [Bacteroidota bacterium]